MSTTPSVLAACPPFALPTLQKVLGSYIDFVHADTLDKAEQILRTNNRIAMIVCGVHFGQSALYDLLKHAKREYPRIPFVCVRVLDAQNPLVSWENARALGASEFIDVASLREKLGGDQAEAELRASVLKRILRD